MRHDVGLRVLHYEARFGRVRLLQHPASFRGHLRHGTLLSLGPIPSEDRDCLICSVLARLSKARFGRVRLLEYPASFRGYLRHGTLVVGASTLSLVHT